MDRNRERALDDYLVAAARLGDHRTFELLARRWNHKLLAHAWRLLGDTENAKEAVQDTWAEVVRGMGGLNDSRAFAAWVYRIVSRRCARLVGQAQRRRRLEEPLPDETEAPARLSEDASDIDKLRAAIRALPPGQRAAVALFHLEEMSIPEVAVALDIPAGTVKTRLMHARRKLRAILEGEHQ